MTACIADDRATRAIKDLHWSTFDDFYEYTWQCHECHRDVPCSTMRLLEDGVEAVRAIHFAVQREYHRWRHWHRETFIYLACREDGQVFPCRTVRVIEALEVPA